MSSVSDPPSLGMSVGVGAAYALLVCSYLVAGGWYYARRQIDIIAARQPTVVVWYVLAGIIFLATSQGSWIVRQSVFCETGTGPVLAAISDVALCALFAGAVWRCVQIVCKHEAQRMRVAIKLREEGFDAVLDNNFFQKNLNALTSYPLALAIAAYCLLPLIARTALSGWVVTAADSAFGGVSGVCRPASANAMAYITLSLTAVLSVSWVLLAVFKLSALVDDVFHIRSELTVTGWMSLAHCVLYTVLNGAINEFDRSIGSVFYWWIVFAVLSIPTFALPLFHSYKTTTRRGGKGVSGELYSSRVHRINASASGRITARSKKTAAVTAGTGMKTAKNDKSGKHTNRGSSRRGGASGVRTPDELHAMDERDAHVHERHVSGGVIHVPRELQSLGALLQSKAGRKSFENHLLREFAIESLMFVDSIQLLRTLQPIEGETTVRLTEARDRAVDIYRRFVVTGAPFEVNLSHTVKGGLHRELGAISIEKLKMFRQSTACNLALVLQSHTEGKIAGLTSKNASLDLTAHPPSSGAAGASAAGGASVATGNSTSHSPATASGSNATAANGSPSKVRKPLTAATATPPLVPLNGPTVVGATAAPQSPPAVGVSLAASGTGATALSISVDEHKRPSISTLPAEVVPAASGTVSGGVDGTERFTPNLTRQTSDSTATIATTTVPATGAAASVSPTNAGRSTGATPSPPPIVDPFPVNQPRRRSSSRAKLPTGGMAGAAVSVLEPIPPTPTSVMAAAAAAEKKISPAASAAASDSPLLPGAVPSAPAAVATVPPAAHARAPSSVAGGAVIRAISNTFHAASGSVDYDPSLASARGAGAAHIVRDAEFYMHVFDAAQFEVYKLLESDSWARYIQSPAFEQLLSNFALMRELEAQRNPASGGVEGADGDEDGEEDDLVEDAPRPRTASVPPLRVPVAATTAGTNGIDSSKPASTAVAGVAPPPAVKSAFSPLPSGSPPPASHQPLLLSPTVGAATTAASTARSPMSTTSTLNTNRSTLTGVLTPAAAAHNSTSGSGASTAPRTSGSSLLLGVNRVPNPNRSSGGSLASSRQSPSTDITPVATPAANGTPAFRPPQPPATSQPPSPQPPQLPTAAIAAGHTSPPQTSSERRRVQAAAATHFQFTSADVKSSSGVAPPTLQLTETAAVPPAALASATPGSVTVPPLQINQKPAKMIITSPTAAGSSNKKNRSPLNSGRLGASTLSPINRSMSVANMLNPARRPRAAEMAPSVTPDRMSPRNAYPPIPFQRSNSMSPTNHQLNKKFNSALSPKAAGSVPAAPSSHARSSSNGAVVLTQPQSGDDSFRALNGNTPTINTPGREGGPMPQQPMSPAAHSLVISPSHNPNAEARRHLMASGGVGGDSVFASPITSPRGDEDAAGGAAQKLLLSTSVTPLPADGGMSVATTPTAAAASAREAQNDGSSMMMPPAPAAQSATSSPPAPVQPVAPVVTPAVAPAQPLATPTPVAPTQPTTAASATATNAVTAAAAAAAGVPPIRTPHPVALVLAAAIQASTAAAAAAASAEGDAVAPLPTASAAPTERRLTSKRASGVHTGLGGTAAAPALPFVGRTIKLLTRTNTIRTARATLERDAMLGSASTSAELKITIG